MLNEAKFLKSVKCRRKAWLIENTANCANPPPLAVPGIIGGEKNRVFRSPLGEATVGCVTTAADGKIKLYDFFDTVKYRKHIVRMNYKRAIAESCGCRICGVFAVTVNPKFEKGGKKPFYIINRIEKPKSPSDFLRCIERTSAAAAAERPAAAVMKNDCAGCEFFKSCFNLPKNNIFQLKGLDFSEKVALFSKNIVTFDDYMKNNPSAVCRMQITGETHIDKAAIRDFLGKLSYPLGFLDFETISPLAPAFPGYHPGDKIITQFSYHQRNESGGGCFHREFIGDGLHNPEPDAVSALISAAKTAKTILSYSVYEKNCIEMLAKRFPEHKNELKNMAAKIVDLEIPFRKRMYSTPLMQGRTSLKFVLPALYPNDAALDYHKMKVPDGEAAVKAYMSLREKPENERKNIIANLKKYCSLDTLALVKITDKLYEVTK